jgi:hypothetical protein
LDGSKCDARLQPQTWRVSHENLLHAQAKPPVYRISEIEITNVDAYTKEFAPKAQAALKSAGGRFLAAGQNVTALEGEPPKTRVTIQVWDSLEK